MCYTLKAIGLKESYKEDLVNMTWRIRPAIVHHQFDVQKGTQLWLIGDPLNGVHDIIREHVHEERKHGHRYGTVI